MLYILARAIICESFKIRWSITLVLTRYLKVCIVTNKQSFDTEEPYLTGKTL